MHPTASEAKTAGLIVMRTVFIVSDLSLIGFACLDDSHGGVTWRVDHHKQALFNHAHRLVTLLAVATSSVGRHNSIGIINARAA